MSKPKVISIDGIDYIRVSEQQPAELLDNMPYVVVRSATASPFAGYLKSKTDLVVTLVRARRIRSWQGAMDLSQLANEGTTKPNNCQFSAPAVQVDIPFNEIHYATIQGAKSIQEVPEWKI